MQAETDFRYSPGFCGPAPVRVAGKRVAHVVSSNNGDCTTQRSWDWATGLGSFECAMANPFGMPCLKCIASEITVVDGTIPAILGRNAMIRTVLVDDHELVRAGFRLILSGQPDIEVVGEAGDAEDGLRLIRAQKPDVALVDVHMPGMSGIELTERVHRADLPTRIVILTVVRDAQFPRRLLQSGALGYLTKGCAAGELLDAVRRVARGERYLDVAVARQMALATVDGDGSPLEKLSARELEVSLMLARGLAVNEIAGRLHLSAKTVSTYKQRVFEKLGVSHTIALAHVLAAHGMLAETPPAMAGGG